MTRLPQKRQRPRSGIERAPPREWPRHRKFVRSFACSVPLCDTGVMVQFAHIRSAANSGVAIKPHDAFGVSLCADHHAEQHRIGQPAFERKYSIDLKAMALEFVRASPDRAMRDSLKLVDAETLA